VAEWCGASKVGRVTSGASVPEVLVRELMHHFMIPQAGVRVWGSAPNFASLTFAQPVSDDVKSFAASLTLQRVFANKVAQ